MNRLGPFFWQTWRGPLTSGVAFAFTLLGSYYCVELRRDPRHR